MPEYITPTQVIARLRDGEPHSLIVLAIPSHDRRNKPLNNQELWADAGLRRLAELFRGATAFKTFKGIYRADNGEDLIDEPILIECYAETSEIEQERNLEQLLEFLRRMKRDANQEAVLLVIDSFVFFI